MAFITKTFYSQSDLISHLKAHQPSFYFSSKTSTVIPYDKIESLLPWSSGDFFLCDLSKLPPKMELKSNGNLVLSGGVSWEDAKNFLKANGRNLKTSPTEQLALITAGVATSCTGERCFGFGNMRSQVVRLKYLDYNGEEKELLKDQEFASSSSYLKSYQEDFNSYKNFKNAPYPRFEKSIDLMIGTEGQLGIVSEVFEDIYANVLCNFQHISADEVFEIAENKFHHVRAGVPRAIFEENSKMGVVKVGTDCQVGVDKFTDLLNFYRKAAQIGVRYCLFGHFGDAHLHYNYMPSKDQTQKCLDMFQELYNQVYEWKGSPFAEHGIGLIKQKYIKKYHGEHQLGLFKDLKKEHDPYRQFFPQGFMSV